MPKAYVIAHIRVHDAAKFEPFKSMSGPAIREFGGRVLVRNQNIDHRKGAETGTCVVVEFDSLDQARTVYDPDTYIAARQLRGAAAETGQIIVEGV